MSHSGPHLRGIAGVPAWVVTFKHGNKVETYRVEAWKQGKAIRLACAIRRTEAKLRGAPVPPATQIFARRAPAVSTQEVSLS